MFSQLFEIKERTAEEVVVVKAGPLVCNQPTGMYFSNVSFQLRPTGPDSVLVSYEIGFDRLASRLRRTALIVILGVGLPLIVGLGLGIWFGVVQNENPATRWQVFQLFHLAHALWPPFLILYFYGAGRSHSRTYISNVLATLDVKIDAAPVR